MVAKNNSKMFNDAGIALQDAVKKELIKKAKLGQYAIVQKNGKTIRILASELLKEEN